MTFLTDDPLASAVTAIMGEADAACAVAFWGRGAASLLSKALPARVICNLQTGGTNPHEIEKLDRALVRQLDDLHAKVYIGRDKAIVASVNASSNGLGLEGEEQAKWAEAGYVVDDLAPLKAWFEHLWNHRARLISDADMKLAKKAWEKRQRAKPSLADFADFDRHGTGFPLVSWIDAEMPLDWNETAIEKQTGSPIDKAFRKRLDYGLGICPEDRPMFENGRWVFVYTRRRSDGLPSKRPKPYLTFLKGSLLRAATVDGTRVDWVPRAEDVPPVPFSISLKLVECFSKAISDRRYDRLRDTDYPTPYFKPFEDLMRQLWSDTASRYDERANQRSEQ